METGESCRFRSHACKGPSTTHKRENGDTVVAVVGVPTVQVDDIQVYYEVHGDGFPLLLIMGLSGNLAWWDPRLVAALAHEFQVVLFDNRGAGRTSRSDRAHTIRLCADDTAGLMEALRIESAHVMGFSMGGMIAQELALIYPEKVAKLVLCSTHCGGAHSVQPSQEVLGMLTADFAGLSPEEVARMSLPLMLTPRFIDEHPDLVEQLIHRVTQHPIAGTVYRRQLIAIAAFATFDRLPQITAPTLILQGRADVLVPAANGRVLRDAIPDAQLSYLEHSAHLLVEDLPAVIHRLLGFLSQAPA